MKKFVRTKMQTPILGCGRTHRELRPPVLHTRYLARVSAIESIVPLESVAGPQRPVIQIPARPRLLQKLTGLEKFRYRLAATCVGSVASEPQLPAYAERTVHGCRRQPDQEPWNGVYARSGTR